MPKRGFGVVCNGHKRQRTEKGHCKMAEKERKDVEMETPPLKASEGQMIKRLVLSYKVGDDCKSSLFGVEIEDIVEEVYSKEGQPLTPQLLPCVSQNSIDGLCDGLENFSL
jgi:hypothetical protein